jgi:hypothetical protein
MKHRSQGARSPIISSHMNFQSVSPSIRLFVCPSVYSSVLPTIHPSVCPIVSLSVCPSVHSFFRLSICLFFPLSNRPSVHQSISPSIRPFIHPSLPLSVRTKGKKTFSSYNKSDYHLGKKPPQPIENVPVIRQFLKEKYF